MQLIVQSSFLKALTVALLTSIWQMALAWMVVLLVFRVFKLSAAQKFNIAFSAQLTGFLLFIYTLVYLNTNAISDLNNSNFIYTDKLHDDINALMPYVGIIYLTALLYQFSKLLFSYNVTQRLRKFHLKKMPAANRIFIQHITALFSLKRKVSIYLSSAIQCPMTVGFFKPVILVPLAAINHLTKEQMEAVLLHEMAHIKRYDYLLNIIQSFIQKIFFFNIFSRMIHDIIEHERENACDDLVLQFRYNAFHYAEALLKLGKLQTINSFAMAASGKKESVLLYRIRRLVHHNNQSINYRLKTLMHSFLVLIIALLLLILSISSNSNLSKAPVVKNATFFPSIEKNETALKTRGIISKRSKNLPGRLTAKSTSKQLLKKDNIKPEINLATTNTIHVPDYFIDVNHSLDSLKQTTYAAALNKNIILNNDAYKKALSYQNFKQLEAMLQASGKSITITEDPVSKDSYKKLITIEATDAQGNQNVYKVIVELYQ